MLGLIDHPVPRGRCEELETANRELEAFSYSVAHDLRAPLRSIDGFSRMLLEDHGEELGEEGRDYLRRLREAGRRMGELVDDLLELARVTHGALRRESVDLSALAGSIAWELRQGDLGRRVEFEIEDGLVAEGDARLLHVVLGNLMHNAWKFTSKHPEARIEFGAVRHEGGSAYYVRDDGVGFDMAYADKLFGPCQRLHGRDEFDGTGIGLTTVARIIRRHGGRVWAEGAVEGGATFYFALAPSAVDDPNEAVNLKGGDDAG